MVNSDINTFLTTMLVPPEAKFNTAVLASVLLCGCYGVPSGCYEVARVLDVSKSVP